MPVDGDPIGGFATALSDGSGPSSEFGVTNLTRPGESVYEVAVGGRDARLTVDVAEPAGDERTVGIRYAAAAETFEETIAGGAEAVRDELAGTPAAPFVSLVGFPSVAAVADIGALPAGRQLPVPGAGKAASVEVTEPDDGSGAERYRSVWRYDGTVRYEDCITRATRFKTRVVYDTADGDPFVRIELLETTVENAR